jgi:hypothetical protein
VPNRVADVIHPELVLQQVSFVQLHHAFMARNQNVNCCIDAKYSASMHTICTAIRQRDSEAKTTAYLM